MRSVAAIAMIALVLVLAGGGSLLSRIDRLKAEQRATAAQVRLVEARAELAAIVQRDLKPVNDARVEVCVRRTDALRKAIFALVRTGTAAMPNDPGWEWIAWK